MISLVATQATRGQRAFLWIGVVGVPILAVCAALAWPALQANTWLAICFLFAAIPSLIAQYVALHLIVRRFRFAVLGVLVLLPFPKVLLLALCFGPFVYLTFALLKLQVPTRASPGGTG